MQARKSGKGRRLVRAEEHPPTEDCVYAEDDHEEGSGDESMVSYDDDNGNDGDDRGDAPDGASGVASGQQVQTARARRARTLDSSDSSSDDDGNDDDQAMAEGERPTVQVLTQLSQELTQALGSELAGRPEKS